MSKKNRQQLFAAALNDGVNTNEELESIKTQRDPERPQINNHQQTGSTVDRGEENKTAPLPRKVVEFKNMVETPQDNAKKDQLYISISQSVLAQINAIEREYNYKMEANISRNHILRAILEDYTQKNSNKIIEQLKSI